MMPECLDCGNREAFDHFGYGHELREYDPETGEYLRTTIADVETDHVECAVSDCQSSNVEFSI